MCLHCSPIPLLTELRVKALFPDSAQSNAANETRVLTGEQAFPDAGPWYRANQYVWARIEGRRLPWRQARKRAVCAPQYAPAVPGFRTAWSDNRLLRS